MSFSSDLRGTGLVAFSVLLACGGGGGDHPDAISAAVDAPALDAAPVDGARPDAIEPDAAPLDAALAAIGEPCTAAEACAGAHCIDAWPLGYCSAQGCVLENPYNSCYGYVGDGVCVDVGDPDTTYGMCLDRCDLAVPDCREGYDCVDLGYAAACMPPPVCGNGFIDDGEECDPPVPGGCSDTCQLGTDPVGAPCSSPATCAGNFCINDDLWIEGYCTQANCDLETPATSCLDYGGDGYCTDVGSLGSPIGACLDRCALDAPDCRSGYECIDLGRGIGRCVPDGPEWIGGACATGSDCTTNQCLVEADGWPGGYCTAQPCSIEDPETSCQNVDADSYCLDLGDGVGACVDGCADDETCRLGYTCQTVGAGASVCLP